MNQTSRGPLQTVPTLEVKPMNPRIRTRPRLHWALALLGLLPNTDWLKGTLKLSPRGEIEVDARGQTSLPGVFAAGDATTVPYKQIIIAMGEGAKASLSAFDHLIRSPAPAAAPTLDLGQPA